MSVNVRETQLNTRESQKPTLQNRIYNINCSRKSNVHLGSKTNLLLDVVLYLRNFLTVPLQVVVSESIQNKIKRYYMRWDADKPYRI